MIPRYTIGHSMGPIAIIQNKAVCANRQLVHRVDHGEPYTSGLLSCGHLIEHVSTPHAGSHLFG